MTDAEDLVALLKPHADAIKASANAGNRRAQQTIIWYEAYRRCPEAAALVICQEAFKAWLLERAT